MSNSISRRSKIPSLVSLKQPQLWALLCLGFVAGLPLLLIFSTLSLWLREAGVERSAVTFFSWAALAYSFKFVWAPLVDRLPIPLLNRTLGRRRAWLLLAQTAVIIAVLAMALTDPAQTSQLTQMAIAAVLLGFAAATQDIVIDAYRIEAAGVNLQALLASAYIAGYRIGMLTAGAGALWLAEELGSTPETYCYSAWRATYLAMAGVMLLGPLTTLWITEPQQLNSETALRPLQHYLGFVLTFLGAVAAFISIFTLIGIGLTQLSMTYTFGAAIHFLGEALRLSAALLAAWLTGRSLVALGLVDQVTLEASHIAPVREFFQRYGVRTAWLLLALVGVYRISDIVLGVIANVFYQDLGFSKSEIATFVNSFGLLMTLVGGFLGGILALRYGVTRILPLGAILSAATNLLFLLLAQVGHDNLTLCLVIAADNLAAGLASAAFVAFLSSLTHISFTAVQYAIFSSLMTLLPKFLGGYSGTLVSALGYSGFFLFTTVLGLPVLWLVWRVRTVLASSGEA